METYRLVMGRGSIGVGVTRMYARSRGVITRNILSENEVFVNAAPVLASELGMVLVRCAARACARACARARAQFAQTWC
jgi:hypothetical protein